MPSFALHHVQVTIPVGGEDRARAFYGGVLGLTEVAKPPELATRGGCWFRSGSLELHLGAEDPFLPARRAHPGILVSDGFDEVLEAMQQAGVEAVPDSNFPGFRRVYVNDPFGNRLELLSPLPDPS
ncbi:VOC family protein [Euzebya tangerina]|uniref:VOC family protein n=1 Tax=Euzebya tangerina TaxID=591198 RepID=UPI000E310AB9|nr:VOC family protein [Euzebya tangerina]